MRQVWNHTTLPIVCLAEDYEGERLSNGMERLKSKDCVEDVRHNRVDCKASRIHFAALEGKRTQFHYGSRMHA
jgi:hypothetical protein